MANTPSGLRPMRLILRHPFVEQELTLVADKPAPSRTPPAVPNWNEAQLRKDITHDGGLNIYAKATEALGGKGPAFEAAAPGEGAWSDVGTGTVYLPPGLSRPQAAETAIFELTNISNRSTFEGTISQAERGLLDREGYARALASTEYLSAQNANNAFHSSGQFWGAGPGAVSNFDAFEGLNGRINPNGFNTVYDQVLGDRYKDVYRERWDAFYKSGYEQQQRMGEMRRFLNLDGAGNP